MRAAWYERQGPAADVLVIGEMPNPEPEPGEVRIAVAASGINPGDVKKRRDDYGYGMPYPRVAIAPQEIAAHALVEQGARGGRVVINPIYTGR